MHGFTSLWFERWRAAAGRLMNKQECEQTKKAESKHSGLAALGGWHESSSSVSSFPIKLRDRLHVAQTQWALIVCGNSLFKLLHFISPTLIIGLD